MEGMLILHGSGQRDIYQIFYIVNCYCYESDYTHLSRSTPRPPQRLLKSNAGRVDSQEYCLTEFQRAVAQRSLV